MENTNNQTELLWRTKVTANLLEDYDQALKLNTSLTNRKVTLTLSEKNTSFSEDIEILSAIDEQIVAEIPFFQLPSLASLTFVKAITQSYPNS